MSKKWNGGSGNDHFARDPVAILSSGCWALMHLTRRRFGLKVVEKTICSVTSEIQWPSLTFVKYFK